MTDTSQQLPELSLPIAVQEEVPAVPSQGQPQQEDARTRAMTHDDRHAYWELRRRDIYAA